MTSGVRIPAVAGRFYPLSSGDLLREIREYTSPPQSALVAAIGCLVPHAGYMYSGHVAGSVYSRLLVPEHCLILCPNHTGRGVPLAIMSETAWQTSLGEIAPSTALASRLLRRFPSLEENSAAHRSEHAIEVQLPFLQKLQKDLRIVPIAIGTNDFDVLHGLGEAVAEVVGESKEKVLIVASSDMNHYESDAVTRIKDHHAIEQVLAQDPRRLWEVVMSKDISMCGVGPAIVMLTAAKMLGATTATLVRYATSGDVSGDRERVVGYAGIIVQ